MKSINILIIAYKQQEIITRALDSILCQKDYGLHHIVVCDDCSPDNTWEVLESYRKRYPDIMRIYQNSQNLGIYGNWNQMIAHKGEADLYYIMAGDDALCDGFFERVQIKAEQENIDCNEPVALYFDWKYVNPNGDEHVMRNDAILKTKDVFGLKLRNRISCRSCIASKGVMDQYPLIELNYGISFSESMADLQYSILAKKNYYDSYVGSIYYAGIGVSVSLFTKKYYEDSVKAIDVLINRLSLKTQDYYWMCYRRYLNDFFANPSIKSGFLTLKYYVLGEKYISAFMKCRRFVSVIKSLIIRKY